MSSPWIHWLQLALCAALILVAGTRLSYYGHLIARHTGLGGGWIGIALVASVTSLPELVTGIASVTVAGVPDIAVGNVLGACVLNLAMMVVLDALRRHASIYQVASQGHALGAMGWTDSFVGTLLVALATTLPELTVTIASVRIGALDLAIGNLVGSNLFNLAILGVDDFFYVEGPLLAAASPAHVLSAVSGSAMSGALIVALIARPQARLLNFVGFTSVALALIFFVNAWLHLRQSG